MTGPRADVVVWLVHVDDVARPGRHCSVGERRLAAGRRGGERWLAGRSAVREILGATVGVHPSALELVYDPAGKPRLDDGAVAFSLSHSGPWVAVATASTLAVGVDIEAPRPLHRPERLAARLFDEGERARWSGGSVAARHDALLQRWTEVEAVLKATGEGIRGGMRGALADRHRLGWRVRPLGLAEVRGAVALQATEWRIHHRRYPLRP